MQNEVKCVSVCVYNNWRGQCKLIMTILVIDKKDAVFLLQGQNKSIDRKRAILLLLGSEPRRREMLDL